MRTAFVVAVLLSLAAGAFGQQRPTAYVLEHKDKWTGSAEASTLLREAGFDVSPLPLDRSPFLFDVDLIVIGSFACEHPDYAKYMKAYAADLYNYVDKGHTLLEFTQADQFEGCASVSSEHPRRDQVRCGRGKSQVLSPDHPLMAGIVGPMLTFSDTRTVWEAFAAQGGFEVMLAAEDEASHAALMEGAYGQGRIILSALALDKANVGQGEAHVDRAALKALRGKFFANLASHVVNVRNRTTRAVHVTPSSMDARRFAPGSWSLAVLPDTQVYSLRYPGLFISQTGWLVQNADRLNIKYVLHLGDIVNNNTPYEWRNARDAMSLLDGRLPYALVPGNHDYGPSGDASTRETLLNEFFSFDTTTSMPTFGGAMESGKLDNTFHLFEAGGHKWIIIALEWGPRDEAVAWADEVMRKHADREGILITHAYMNNNDLRYDHTDKEHPQHYNPHEYRTPGSKNDGEELWQKLVRKHEFRLVLNGHVLGDGTGYAMSTNDAGHAVHQMLSNYQMRTLGGEGYLRLLEFRKDGRVMVKTYSPVYDGFLLESDQTFSFMLDDSGVKAK